MHGSSCWSNENGKAMMPCITVQANERASKIQEKKRFWNPRVEKVRHFDVHLVACAYLECFRQGDGEP